VNRKWIFQLRLGAFKSGTDGCEIVAKNVFDGDSIDDPNRQLGSTSTTATPNSSDHRCKFIQLFDRATIHSSHTSKHFTATHTTRRYSLFRNTLMHLDWQILTPAPPLELKEDSISKTQRHTAGLRTKTLLLSCTCQSLLIYPVLFLNIIHNIIH